MPHLIEPVELTTHFNPYDDRDIDQPGELKDAFDAFLVLDEKSRAFSRRPFLQWGRIPGTSNAEHLLRMYRRSHASMPRLNEWHRGVTNWMPRPAFRWWESQFDINPTLDGMSRPWWLLRIRAYNRARVGGIDVGGATITEVRRSERPILNDASSRPLFYEMRGLVVEPGYRRAGIGRQTVDASIASAYQLAPALPLFAATRNEVAAGIFHSTGATDTPASPEFPDEALNQVACWDYPESLRKRCAACPMTKGNCWWWATHNRLSAA